MEKVYWEDLSSEDQEIIEQHFFNQREYDGAPITEESYEELFERYLGNMFPEDLIELLNKLKNK